MSLRGPRKPVDRNRAERKPVDPYERGLGLLARREHSRRELDRKLRARGAEPEAAIAALDKLGSQQFQSDDRFAAVLVRSRIGNGYGPARIRAELAAQHGLDQSAIEAAIAEEVETSGIDWLEEATRQLQRRYRQPSSDRAETMKRMQFLLRRGFPADIARQACAGGNEPED